MKKYFNPKLYIDGLRQLLLGGTILLFVSSVITVLPPICSMAEGSTDYPVDLCLIAPVLFVFMFIGGFVLPYTLFKFVNKRNSSDYYDGLPNSRLATFTSLALSAFTWIAGIITVNMILGTVAWIITGSSINHMSQLFLWWIYFIIGTFMVAACTFIAMAITGTTLSNFITAGIIMFLPRAILVFSQTIMIESGKILTFRIFDGFTHPANNLMLAAPLSVMFGYNLEYFISRPFSYVYSAVMLIFLIAAAAFLFTRRKSENAEKNAPNRFLQHVYRCCLALPFTLLWAYMVLLDISYADDFTFILVLLAISAIVYFVYEAITTRSMKKIIRSIPLFFVMLGLSLVIAFTSSAIGKTLMHKVPNSRNVESINISEYHGNWADSQEYYKNILSDITFSNEQLTDSMIDALQSSIDDAENSNLNGFMYTVTFNLKNGSKMEREVFLSDQQRTDLYHAMELNEEYMQLIRSTMAIDNYKNINLSNGIALSEEEEEEIYKSLDDDLKEMPIENVRKTIKGDALLSIYVDGIKPDGSYVYTNYNLLYAPKALSKYMEITSNKESMEKSLDLLSKRISTDDIFYENSIYISEYSNEGSTQQGVYPQEESKVNMDKLYSILKKGAARTPSEKYIPVIIDINSYAYPTESAKVDDAAISGEVTISTDVPYAEISSDGGFHRNTLVSFLTKSELDEITVLFI